MQFAQRILGVGLLGALLLLWCSLGVCCTAERPEASAVEEPAVVADDSTTDNGGGAGGVAQAAAPVVDLESRPLPRIPAGTVIGKGTPDGWSHFVMIAIPTLTPEDRRDAPKIAAHYAQMFKFTLLARSRKVGNEYRLESVARGFAMTVRGREIIVAPKQMFGGNPGVFGDRILAENEKHIDADVRQVARTATMLLFDAQAVMRQGSDHVRMVLRHALVLDPATNKLHTFVWLLSKDRANYTIAEKTLQLIPEGLREDRYLSVKRDKFVLGLPTPEAFALVRTPQGKAITWTAELAKLAAVKEFTPEQALSLEKQFLALGQSQAKK